MRNILKLQGLFLIMLLFGSADILSATDAPLIKGNLPAIKKDCTTCHMPHGSGGMLALKEPVTKLCIGCHPDRKGSVEHKVDVVPAMLIPGLPLTEGKLACITCHDPHSNIHGNMLRLSPQKLCVACHKY